MGQDLAFDSAISHLRGRHTQPLDWRIAGLEGLTPFCNTMHRAEFERMPGGSPDQLPESGTLESYDLR